MGRNQIVGVKRPAIALHRRVNKRKRSRNVVTGSNSRKRHVTRTRTRTKRKSGVNSSEFSSGFVKCYRRKAYNRRRVGRKFVRKVKRAVLEDVPRNTWLTSTGFQLVNFSSSPWNNCMWMQVGLDVVNADVVYNIGQLDNAGNMQTIERVSAGFNTYSGPGAQNTGLKQIAFNAAFSPAVLPASGGNSIFEKSYSSCQLVVKNPKPWGYTIEVYRIRPKRAMAISSDIQTTFQGPLEAFSKGLNYNITANEGIVKVDGTIGGTVVSGGLACAHYSSNLQDSTLFQQYYRVTKRCKVAVPPGGTFEQWMKHPRLRRYSKRWLMSTIEDRNTEWIVMKVIPEPLVASETTGAYRTYPTLPLEVSSNEVHGIIGVVNYRYTIKHIQVPSDIPVQHYQGAVPVSDVSHLVTGGVAGNVMTHGVIQ